VAAGSARRYVNDPHRQRQLTLVALEEKVKTARAAVIASAQGVVDAVQSTEDEWRSLLQSRQTIATDARQEADRLLTEAWQKEQRIARIGVFFTRISQGSPLAWTPLPLRHVAR
jgi:hypothetical protein